MELKATRLLIALNSKFCMSLPTSNSVFHGSSSPLMSKVSSITLFRVLSTFSMTRVVMFEPKFGFNRTVELLGPSLPLRTTLSESIWGAFSFVSSDAEESARSPNHLNTRVWIFGLMITRSKIMEIKTVTALSRTSTAVARHLKWCGLISHRTPQVFTRRKAVA